MKPLLIIAQEAGGIPFGLKKGFEKLGIECILEVYDDPVFKTNHSLLDRIYHRVLDPGYQKEIKNLFNKTINKYEQKIKEGHFSLILIMRGNELNAKNFKILTERGCALFTYLYDPLRQSTMQKQCADISDYIFCADMEDIVNYKAKSSFLPLGYDDDVYYSSQNEKYIDVFISGSIGNGYKKRREILEELGKNSFLENKKIFFVGSTGFSLTDLKVNIGNINWVAKRVSHLQIAEYQRRAKICVNVHRDDSESIVNPSFFSIPGSGSCQVAEKREVLRKIMTPQKDYAEFENFDELLSILKDLLENDDKREAIAKNGFNKVKNEHTLLNRAKFIILKYQELKNV